MTHDDLKQNIERMEKELAAMKAKLRRNWPEKLVKGMVFRHKRMGHFMTRPLHSSGDELDLVALDDSSGNFWREGKCFNGSKSEFTYIGMFNDVFALKPTTGGQIMTEKNEKPSIDKARAWLNAVLAAVAAVPSVEDASVRRDLARCAELLRGVIAEEFVNFAPY